MKSVSDENLARFKAKCDETYQKKGSGGITNAEVIKYAEQLPTATVDSPNLQTPDGTLYRKKAVEGGSLLGTWVIHEGGLQIFTNYTFAISFTSNENSYNSLKFEVSRETVYVKYDSTTVATGTVSAMNWTNDNYRTITITDTSSLTNVEEFTTLMGNIAIQTGGGASVSYEYVAMQEVPTPTTADNGKVLGVTNGAYALQEAGGGGATGYTVSFNQVSGGTIIYSDGTTETIGEVLSNVTKNNVRMIIAF